MARRFLSEARAASRVRHPNVVDVTDVGLLSDGRPYMVMERLAGESLEARLDRSGPLAPLSALLVAREVALALGAAHEGGVVHRDLKPANVILLETSRDDAPRLKLVDFGAACLTGAVADESEGLIGTPAYMSPEHARGEPTDGRTDIYALGILLFEMLCGAQPFTGANAREILLAHLSLPAPPLESPSGTMPQAVQRVVARALRKNAGERHQSAAELVADLDHAIAAAGRRDWRRWLPS
jgi:serine/threonine-protein kinase